MFMNVFRGTFETLKSFRRELKKGAPDSIFAIIGFILLSLIFTIAIVLLSAGLFTDTQIVKNIGAGALLTAGGTFVYNVIKAAWECFVDDRQELIDILRNS
jgi:phage tail tape-measure protein